MEGVGGGGNFHAVHGKCRWCTMTFACWDTRGSRDFHQPRPERRIRSDLMAQTACEMSAYGLCVATPPSDDKHSPQDEVNHSRRLVKWRNSWVRNNLRSATCYAMGNYPVCLTHMISLYTSTHALACTKAMDMHVHMDSIYSVRTLDHMFADTRPYVCRH